MHHGVILAKCGLTGEDFEISSQEKAFFEKHSLPLPKKSEAERLRALLAFVPDIEWIQVQRWLESENISSDYEERRFELPAFTLSQNSFMPRLVASELARDDMVRPEQASPTAFMDELHELYLLYLNNIKMLSSGHKIDSSLYLCRNTADSAECFACSDLKDCYECTFCTASSNLVFSRNSHNCKDSFFLESCVDCSECLFCSFLEGKRFHIFNEQVTPEEYKRAVLDLHLASPVRLEAARERFEIFLSTRHFPEITSVDSDTTSGAYILDSRNSHEVLLARGVSDSSVLALIDGDAKSLFTSVCSGSMLRSSSQLVLTEGNTDQCLSLFSTTGKLSNIEYSIACENSSHLLGCIGLSGKEYCILNRQYTRSEYLSRRDSIISELRSSGIWGSFFPTRFNMLPYNASLAGILFPLGKVQAQLLGYLWDDSRDEIQKTVKAFRQENVLSTDLNAGEKYSEASKSICEISGVEFQIGKEERGVCERLKIALPERAPQQRFHDRLMSLHIGRKRVLECPITKEGFTTWHTGPRPLLSLGGFDKVRT